MAQIERDCKVCNMSRLQCAIVSFGGFIIYFCLWHFANFSNRSLFISISFLILGILFLCLPYIMTLRAWKLHRGRVTILIMHSVSGEASSLFNIRLIIGVILYLAITCISGYIGALVVNGLNPSWLIASLACILLAGYILYKYGIPGYLIERIIERWKYKRGL